MKLRILSDVHLEHIGDYIVPPLCDDIDTILLLAGDICQAVDVGVKHNDFFKRISSQFSSIIYVMGNHEHYHSIFSDTKSLLIDALSEFKNIHILDNEYLDVDSVRFIGSTMWANFDNNTAVIDEALLTLSDYKNIHTQTGNIHPLDIITHNYDSINFIFNNIDNPMNTVVVTHHPPSIISIPKLYKGLLINSAFANSIDDIVRNNGPKLWVHGHMHDSMNYHIGNTNVLCNPVGLLPLGNEHFDEHFVIDL